ncbi:MULTISPECIES: hypothetical protein [Trichocoleus]|uniref:Uncharacterized protein n=1 Tax=Trichocoleus desertorum GB2-A4 TaxID=2933944 RepID=A0ABV0J898_9CYAN|nr:hypothetical protein [Trichocoleus sp. FACHB-46]MBD1861015.1 hypothetical protein [Trichocoleus sp. FACHB-46]
MTARDQVKQEIDRLNEEQLNQVQDFIAFIKFQNRRTMSTFNDNQLADLYNESAAEDRELAEVGMSSYEEMLQQEDIR